MNTNSAINFMPLNIGTLVLIAIGAVVTILAILWGTMRRRAKAASIADSERHEHAIRDAEVADEATSDAPAAIDLPPEPSPIPLAPVAVPEVQASAPATVESSESLPLTTLKGLGPRAAAALAEQGITSIGGLAALDPAQAEALDARLGPLAGRLARDRWVDQAKLLAAGDIAAFEAGFGKLGG
ncbi:MAG: hypothetical protein C0500_07300 [Sphingobium sp.]|nr:hypothetical protein [Sphingobium sp.]